MIRKLMKMILLSEAGVFCLTGCASQTAEQKTVPETVISETQEQVQTEEITETTSLVSEVYFDDTDAFTMYQDYDSFAEAFQKQYPGEYLYQIPEDCGYKVCDIVVCNSNYRIDFEDADNSGFFLEIDFSQTYPSMKAFCDEFNCSVIVEDNQFDIETERYLFEDYADGGAMIYGITGEENIAFALGGGRKREDAHEILKERYEKLNL